MQPSTDVTYSTRGQAKGPTSRNQISILCLGARYKFNVFLSDLDICHIILVWVLDGKIKETGVLRHIPDRIIYEELRRVSKNLDGRLKSKIQ